MGLILLTPPLVEPVSVAELKEFLRVDADDTSQDNTIATLGMAARAWAETFTRRRFVQQTWRVERDFFPGYYARLTAQPGSSAILAGPALLAGIRFAFLLDYPPVRSIDNFQYQNANGALTVLNPATDYIQDLQSNPARLSPPFGQMWPVARVILNAVQIDYTVGYAIPIVVSSTSPLGSIQATGYVFPPTDVGRPISIPGAGQDGGTLNTVISAVASPPTAVAALRDQPLNAVLNVTALLVNAANGNPAHWPLIGTGIKFRVKADYDALPVYLERAKDVLYPVRP